MAIIGIVQTPRTQSLQFCAAWEGFPRFGGVSHSGLHACIQLQAPPHLSQQKNTRHQQLHTLMSGSR